MIASIGHASAPDLPTGQGIIVQDDNLSSILRSRRSSGDPTRSGAND
jgi:hypothetical protein